MANSYFTFKQFTINQNRCAMKVGTDGCLLGAWADISNSNNILDIGCGSGLIAIMSAQRCPQANITGIEIDTEAAAQAIENSKASPWNDRIIIIKKDFLEFESHETFDTILSNPPYFINSLKCPDEKRSKARHADTLTSYTLLLQSYKLLSAKGKLSIVIPYDQLTTWQEQAEEIGYKVTRLTRVHTRSDSAPKRALIEFCKSNDSKTILEDFVLEESPGTFTTQAIELLKPFYLKL